jgi:hypothetical protein
VNACIVSLLVLVFVQPLGSEGGGGGGGGGDKPASADPPRLKALRIELAEAAFPSSETPKSSSAVLRSE